MQIRVNKILTLGASTAIVAAFILTIYLLDRAGEKARVYLIPHSLSEATLTVHVCRNSREVYSLYKSYKIRGRRLIHIGKYLHFSSIPFQEVLGDPEKLPAAHFNIIDSYEERLNVKNVLWVAMQSDIIREIYYVLPAPVLIEKTNGVDRETDLEIVSLYEDAIIAHDWGSKRFISDRLLNTPEPVALNIDASFLGYADASDMLEAFQRSKLHADVITLNLSEDNPEVTEKERKELRKLADMLQKHEHSTHQSH